MKQCIIILVAILFVLTGCQVHSEPEHKEHAISIGDEISHGTPPKSISLYEFDELIRIQKIVALNNENDLQFVAHEYNLESGADIINFLEIIESIPVLKLFDGQIIYIGYQWPVSENNSTGGELTTATQNLGIAYITIQANDGSWFRINYWLKNKDMALEKIIGVSDRSTSLLKTPLQAVNGRCYVYHETREPHSTESGDVITWSAVVDGIPVMIKYYSENANAVKTETVFNNAIIGDIQ